MKIMIESARLKDSQICIIDGNGSLNQYANQEDLSYLANAEEMFDYFKSTLTPVFQERNKIKRQILAEGGEEEELYSYTRKEQPVFIFITDMLWFINTIYSPEGIAQKSNGFMQTLTLKGRLS